MRDTLLIGIDMGGTKIVGAVVTPDGDIISRKKTATPRKSPPKEIFSAVSDVVSFLLADKRITKDQIIAIGMGVPGIFDSTRTKMITSPNLNIDGFSFAPLLQKKFGIPCFTENDVNVGLEGEYWLGAAKGYSNVLGMFPGTGIGGAVILGGKLYTGSHGAGTEIGHMIVSDAKIKCGCGNYGCLEAIASRLAIERDIRAALKKGEKSMITELLSGKKLIKSGMLKKALRSGDKLVTRILENAALYMGYACISLRHLLDPEIIVLGGGIIEACGDFILPIIEKKVNSDPYFSKIEKCVISPAVLGDDAAILGAAALAMERSGHKLKPVRLMPEVSLIKRGKVNVGGVVYNRDLFIRPDGKVKSLNKSTGPAKKSGESIGAKEIKKACKKYPSTLIIGTGFRKHIKLDRSAVDLLKNNSLEYSVCTTPKAVKLYKETGGRKAVLLHLES